MSTLYKSHAGGFVLNLSNIVSTLFTYVLLEYNLYSARSIQRRSRSIRNERHDDRMRTICPATALVVEPSIDMLQYWPVKLPVSLATLAMMSLTSSLE